MCTHYSTPACLGSFRYPLIQENLYWLQIQIISHGDFKTGVSFSNIPIRLRQKCECVKNNYIDYLLTQIPLPWLIPIQCAWSFFYIWLSFCIVARRKRKKFDSTDTICGTSCERKANNDHPIQIPLATSHSHNGIASERHQRLSYTTNHGRRCLLLRRRSFRGCN